MKKKVLLSSIATIALCLCLIAGSTFALFTSQSKINIAVTAGNVDVVATVENFKYFSVKADPSGTIIDENGGKYVYDDRTDEGTFANGGTAVQNGSVITLDKITPGDGISFEIHATNNSDVAVQCRYIIECVSGEELMEGLVVHINENAYPVLKSYTSAWTALAVGESITDDKNIKIEIELPVTAGNEYEGKKDVAINVLVEAVQGNADIGANNGPVIEFLANSNATAVSDDASLQAALDNAVVGENIIVITEDITGNVVAAQKAGVNVTIEGNGHKVSSTIYLHGAARYQGEETLTFKNINFVTDSDSDFDFISANSTASAERYAHNVIVDNCTFTSTGSGDVVGLRLRQTYNITIKNSTFTGMHSILWATGGNGITVDDVTAVNCKNGMSFGTTNGVVVKDCDIDTVGEYGYAIRVDASGAYTLSVENCDLTAAAPILLRKATGAYTAKLTDNTLTTTGAYQVIVTAGDFEDGVALTAPTGAYTLNGAEGLTVYEG